MGVAARAQAHGRAGRGQTCPVGVGQPHPVHGQRGRPEQSQGLRVGHGRTTGRSEIPGQHPAGKQRRQIPPARGEQFHFALEFGQMQTKGRAPVLADRVSPTQIVRARGIEGMAAGRDRAGSLGERCHGRVQSGRDEGLRQRPKTEGLVADQELEPGSGQGPDNRRPGAAADINDSAGPGPGEVGRKRGQGDAVPIGQTLPGQPAGPGCKALPLGGTAGQMGQFEMGMGVEQARHQTHGPEVRHRPGKPGQHLPGRADIQHFPPAQHQSRRIERPGTPHHGQGLSGPDGVDREGRPGTQCLSAGRDLVMKAWSLRTCSSKKARLSCNLAVSALLADVSTAYGVSRRRCNIF